MSQAWVVSLFSSDFVTLGCLRLQPDLEVCQSQEGLWLRGEHFDEARRRELNKLPARGRFWVSPKGELVPWGARLPARELPEGSWQALSDWLELESPLAALPAHLPAPVAIQLMRCTAHDLLPAQEPSLLATNLNHWSRYALEAPLARLRSLRFAESDDGRVLIRGVPLPPLPGQRYWERAGVVLPCGFTTSPRVEAEVLALLLRLAPGELGVFQPNGQVERIPAGGFVPATRRAVRASLSWRAAESSGD